MQKTSVMVWETIDITTEAGETVPGTGAVIISASRATDIPAFYADWFFDRLKRGIQSGRTLSTV